MRNKLIAFIYTFANEKKLSGKHLLIANLAYLKVLEKEHDCDIYVYTKCKFKYIRSMIESLGFKVADNDMLINDTFTHYAYAGTGAHRNMLAKRARVDEYENVIECIKSIKHIRDKHAHRFYRDVFGYLMDKSDVYNLIVDPLNDHRIINMKHLYFCEYETNQVSVYYKLRESYRNEYTKLIKHFYDFKTVNKRDKVFAIFSNYDKNEKRKKHLELSIKSGLKVITDESKIIDSTEYLKKLNIYKFTLVTYSYDPNTFSLLRLMDALALGVVPLVAVSYEDLRKYVSVAFADVMAKHGLIVGWYGFGLPDGCHKAIIREIQEILGIKTK